MNPEDFNKLYYFIGFLIVTGFSSICVGIIFIIRQVIVFARLQFKVEQLEKDMNAAFQKIRAQCNSIQDINEMKDTLEHLTEMLEQHSTKNSGQKN
jgi:hypothetical protein